MVLVQLVLVHLVHLQLQREMRCSRKERTAREGRPRRRMRPRRVKLLLKKPIQRVHWVLQRVKLRHSAHSAHWHLHLFEPVKGRESEKTQSIMYSDIL